MRLTLLEIEELKRQMLARLEAEFYQLAPDSSYRLVARCAETVQRPVTDMPGTALVTHSQNLSDVLLKTLSIHGNPAQWLPNGPHRSASQLRAAEPARSAGPRWPILAEGATRQAGFYRTFDDFRTNKPTEADHLEVERHPNSNAERADDYGVIPYYREANGHRRIATVCWGFSDGQYAYIRFDNEYYRLLPQHDGFRFYTQPKLRSQGGSDFRAAALTRNHYEVNLDAGTGMPFLPAQHLPNPQSIPTQLLIYRPRSAKGPAAHVRLAPDQPTQSLVAGDYLQFSPLAGQPLTVQVQLASGGEATLPILPTAETAIYLECRPDQVIPLQQVKVEVGAAAVLRLVK